MDKKLYDVELGFVFRFYKFGTRKLLPGVNLRLSRNCGYAELQEAFDSVEVLDSVSVDRSDEIVKVLGKFDTVFKKR